MSRRMQAFRANARPDWYRIQAAATDDEPAVVLIYGDIGDSWWGDSVTPSQFVRDLAEIEASAIDFHIHSPGGSAFDGLAIATAVRTHKARTTAYVDGLAASAASIIAIAADETVMAVGAQLMIHDAWGYAMGNAQDMAKMAADLDHLSASLASLYARKAGGTAEEWRTAMLAETWYTAEEAVTAGLADRVDQAVEPADAKAKFDLSMFAYAGRREAPEPAFPGHARAHTSTSAAGGEPPTPEGADTMPDLKQGLRQRLGISAEANLDDDGYLAALDEALAEQPEQPTAVAAVPEGCVVIEKATLANLEANAALGASAHAKQATDRRNALVDAAVTDGRIQPARRDHWLNLLTADEEGTAETLAGLAKGLVPLAAAGYTGGVEENSDDDRLYAATGWAAAEKKGS